MGGKIAFIFIAIIVLGLALYVYNSGVIGRGFDYLNSLASRTSTPPAYVPPYGGSGGGGGEGSTGGTTIGPATTSTAINATTSPYYGQVTFGSVYSGGGGPNGVISLYAHPVNASTSIDVTGWNIKSNRGGIYVPQAVNFYDALGLAPETDIIMHNGDVLYLYSSSAPVNLRLNECLGYLPNRNQFNPQLPQSCPYFNDQAAIQSFSGSCQNYIESLGGCQLPDMRNPQIPPYDTSCINYLETHFNYKTCLDEHQADPNFLSNQIWAWTGSTPLDNYHDNVTLYDKSGLIVATYSY